MSEFVFSFLEDQFRDIYLDCARMDKNLIEGDGVESILIAGRIAEKITKAIYAFEGIKEREDNQYKRIENLSNANILPKNIKKDLSELRRLRNNVYHNTLNSDGSGGFNSYKNNKTAYIQSGGLRDYKTGFNEIKDYSKRVSSNYNSRSNDSSSNLNSNSRNGSRSNDYSSSNLNSKSNNNYSNHNSHLNDMGGELTAAREAHKLVFNICVWFYVNYSEDKNFIRPKYKISRRTQDADFLIRLKSAINDGNDFLKLRQRNPNNEIIQILNEIYIKKTEEKEKEDIVYGINNKEIKIRKPGRPYSKCLGISYDDELFMWRAVHGNKDLGLFESSKEAYEAREIYINSVPMPKKVKGNYSKVRGISFSKIQKLWSVSVKGQIISYHPSEDDAIKSRSKYLKSHNLIDVKVKGGFKTITLEEKAKLDEKARLKKEKSNSKSKRDIKTISSKSSLKKEIKKDEFKYGSKSNSSDTSNLSSKSNLDGSNLTSSNLSSKSNLDGSNLTSSNLSSKTKSDSNNLKDNSSSYYDLFNNKDDSKDKTNKKVKVLNGTKVEDKKASKKVKVSGGKRVSKKHKSKSESKSKSKTNSKSNTNINSKLKSKSGSKSKSKYKSKSNLSNSKNLNKSKKSRSNAINKKKSSKYEGVFYEEGLFMWSAEVDGKHLGLFSSEKEAYEKREEYIKNRSN